jgi:transposase-like protein
LSVKAYAEAHGLVAGTLDWWRRKVRNQARATPRVELMRVGQMAGGRLLRCTDAVRVEFSSLGATLVCEAGADVPTLTAALRALSAVSTERRPE